MLDEPQDAEQMFVIGIGASAGGFDAICQLLRNAPKTGRATFVIAQHLSPRHDSLLRELLMRETDLEVIELDGDVAPLRNKVYVTPPNSDIVLENGVLSLKPPSPTAVTPKPSIDRFFKSLAEELGEYAVGVILSGSGKDGMNGVREVHRAGGITIAQRLRSAKFPNQPAAAIETGCVDLILAPHEIGADLERILSRKLPSLVSDIADIPEEVLELIGLVSEATGIDFNEYKPATILRRLQRRMVSIGIRSYADYLEHCKSSPEELEELHKQFLISVTWFYRDPHEFTALKKRIDQIVADRGHRQIRVWVAGCATGEEAYTIAILFAEALGGPEYLSKNDVQIFASDIDRTALEAAKRGAYSKATLKNTPKEIVDKYFTVDGDIATVIQPLKDVALFTYNNICRDPPFIKLDLACCRNLLIYLNTEQQARVLSRLHYSLLPEGILFLGQAESVALVDDLFVNFNDHNRIYRRVGVSRSDRDTRYADALVQRSRHKPSQAVKRSDADDEQYEMFEAVARALGPNAILTSSNYKILKVYGDIGAYVSINENTSLKMDLSVLRDPLGQDARMIATLALLTNTRQRGAPHRLDPDGATAVQLEAIPFQRGPGDRSHILFIISTHETPEAKRPDLVDTDESAQTYVLALEHELHQTRDALRQTVEELEASNAELQGTNQEIQLTNEELQATNEEIETSNEELQSANEELLTINEELQISASELGVANFELATVLQNLEIPILLVDSSLQINQASSAASALFKLGRFREPPHISQCATPDGFPSLVEIASNTISTGAQTSLEVESADGAYLLTCEAIANPAGQISGAMVALMRAVGAPKEARRRAASSRSRSKSD